jgi:hypothetical protein
MKFCPQRVRNLSDLGKIQQEMSAEIYLVIAGFVKIGAVETILYLGE